MEHVRTALKAIQWERAKGELRAYAALSGSYNSSDGMGEKYEETDKCVESFIADFEERSLHE